ncbi:hypothetical protein [Umezawaea sp. Da 62-37]|uniref:hypothetical protein n=1 Tax=Umezawaea sp. Da 62-37 TaxID=3075927 RepID=UPI0028F6DD34|nr:hypothetical protein [Umezawaea sp. Da 62-37]WNV86109.1 hypothetical protein RM788_49705 [Umezawaea sp. Da 62-37]
MSVRGELAAYLRRTEGRLALVAAATAVAALLVGVVGVWTVHDRQALLDEAVDRRVALTAAALDVYRDLADADAYSLNAVLVGPRQAPELQQRFRQDIFDAVDALRVASARDPEGTSSAGVEELTDLLPEYSRLVETGWANSRLVQPVGTSYLSQASSLVQGRILVIAEELRRKQTDALEAAQVDAGAPAWFAYAVGALALVVLLLAHRFVARRTRRRFNAGLVASAALVLFAMVWLATASVFTAGHADDSVRELDELVAPLAQARNAGRLADGDEARHLIFPRAGDIERLRGRLDEAEGKIAEAAGHAPAGEERDRIGMAAKALKSWREHDRSLLENPESPPTYQETTTLITFPPTGQTTTYAQQLDEHLSAAIRLHTQHSVASTVSAKGALAGLDGVLVVLLAAAAASAAAGLWPRIAEYYR